MTCPTCGGGGGNIGRGIGEWLRCDDCGAGWIPEPKTPGPAGMKRPKLRAWPNGAGYDFGDVELLRPSIGRLWTATKRPAWFGGPTHRGRGATMAEALANMQPLAEFRDYLAAKAANEARRRAEGVQS